MEPLRSDTSGRPDISEEAILHLNPAFLLNRIAILCQQEGKEFFCAE